MGKFLNTLVKTACAGVIAFSTINHLTAQNLIKPKQVVEVKQEQDLYSVVKGLDEREILELYKKTKNYFMKNTKIISPLTILKQERFLFSRNLIKLSTIKFSKHWNILMFMILLQKKKMPSK